MHRKDDHSPHIAADELQKRWAAVNLDRLAFEVSTLLGPHEQEMKEHFRKDSRGMTATQFVNVLMGACLNEVVPTSKEFFSDEESSTIHLQLLFQKCSAGELRATWEGLTMFLSQCRKRVIAKESCASVQYYHTPQLEQPHGIRGALRFCLASDVNKVFCWCADGCVCSASTTNWEIITQRLPISAPVTAVEYAATVQMLFVASCGSQSSLSIFDAHKDTPCCTVESTTRDVCLRWDAMHQRLYSGSLMGEVTLWEYRPGGSPVLRQANSAVPHSGAVITVEPLAIEKLIGSAGQTDGLIVLSDAETLRRVRSVSAMPGGISAIAYDVRNHVFIVGGGGGLLRLWHGSFPPAQPPIEFVDTGQPHQHSISSLCVYGWGSQVVSLDVRGLAKTWDTLTGRCTQTLPSVAKSSDQKICEWKCVHFLSRSVMAISSDTFTAMFSAADSAGSSDALHADSHPVSHIIVDCQNLIAVTAADRSLKVWSLQTSELLVSLNGATTSKIAAVAFGSQPGIVLVGTIDGQLSSHNINSGFVAFRTRAFDSVAVRYLFAVRNDKEELFSMIACGDCVACITASRGTNPHISRTPVAGGLKHASYVEDGSLFCALSCTGLMTVWHVSLVDDALVMQSISSYELVGAMRCGHAPEIAVLLDPPRVFAAADGADLSIVVVSPSKIVRAGSWTTYTGTAIRTMVTFLQRQLLATLEESGSVVVYTVAEQLKRLEGQLPGVFLDADVPPVTIYSVMPFADASLTATAVVPELELIVASNLHLDAFTFAWNGTKLGRFDMTNGSTNEWKLTPTMISRSQSKHLVAVAMANKKSTTADKRDEKQALPQDRRFLESAIENKHHLKLHGSQAPIILDGSTSRNASVLPFIDVPSKRGVRHAPRRRCQSTLPCFNTGDTSLPRPEVSCRSGKCESTMESTKWTLDYEPPKEKESQLPSLRLATSAFNPPHFVVEEQRMLAQERFDITHACHPTSKRAKSVLSRPIVVESMHEHDRQDEEHDETPHSRPTADRKSAIPQWLRSRSTQPPSGGGFFSHS